MVNIILVICRLFLAALRDMSFSDTYKGAVLTVFSQINHQVAAYYCSVSVPSRKLQSKTKLSKI